MPVLTDEAVMHALRSMFQWGFESGEISRRFRFKDFDDAFEFVTQVAALQREMKHYCRVTQEGPIVLVDLRTEGEGGVTERDLDLARRMSACADNAL